MFNLAKGKAMTNVSCGPLFLHEKAPGEARGQEIKDKCGQVEDRAKTGLECCRTSTVNHHNFMNLFRILVSQEGTKRDTARQERQY